MTARFEDIEALAKQFVAQGWTELRVTIGDTQILLSTQSDTLPLGTTTSTATASQAMTASEDSRAITPDAIVPTPVITDSAIEPAWIAVTAPNLGTFYRAPKPGAPPFVEIGQAIEADSEICLIEVMKLFTSVRAGSGGIVRRISAADAQLVEAGQVLFYLEPA
jgi:acetyl-CoA carboxylase biotin carboxyl carrier protein